ATELLEVPRFGREEISLLEFHTMDAVALGEHIGKVHDIDRSFRIRRSGGGLEDSFETDAHDPGAIQLGLIAAFSPRRAGSQRGGGAHEKLSSLHAFTTRVT